MCHVVFYGIRIVLVQNELENIQLIIMNDIFLLFQKVKKIKIFLKYN